MDIVETRRARLKAWVDANGTPQSEKSLFSQLKGTGSFGEKVARRLEAKYKMGAGYLDRPEGSETGNSPSKVAHEANSEVPKREPFYAWLNDDEMRLVTLYRTTDDRGRQEILDEAEATKRVIPLPSLVANKL